jgi:hypothetical protein
MADTRTSHFTLDGADCGGRRLQRMLPRVELFPEMSVRKNSLQVPCSSGFHAPGSY